MAVSGLWLLGKLVGYNSSFGLRICRLFLWISHPHLYIRFFTAYAWGFPAGAYIGAGVHIWNFFFDNKMYKYNSHVRLRWVNKERVLRGRKLSESLLLHPLILEDEPKIFSEARLCLTGFVVIPITISLLLESKLFGNSFALSLWFFSYILLEPTSQRSLWEALGYQMNRGLDGCQTWKMSPNRITLVVKSSFRRNLSR